MILWERIESDFERGVVIVKERINYFINRIFLDANIIKLKYEMERLRKKSDELYREAGERIYERLTSHKDDGANEIKNLFDEIDFINTQSDKIKKEIEERKGAV